MAIAASTLGLARLYFLGLVWPMQSFVETDLLETQLQ
jgi:hypothetical protein